MEVDTDIVTFVLDMDGQALHYLESEKGVAASFMTDDTYSLRLKGGYYAKNLDVSEAILLLIHGSSPPTTELGVPK